MSTAAPAAPAAPAAAPAATPAQPSGSYLKTDAPAPATQPQQPPAGFFRDDVAKDGKFAQGWSERLDQMGYKRLAAKGALAKDEAGFFKMLDDTIGHASGRKISRPTEGASDQDVADFRSYVGAPSEATEYGFLKEGLPEGATRDDMLAGKVEALLHKHHVAKEIGPELSALYVEQLAEMKNRATGALSEKLAEREAATTKALQEEYGQDFDEISQAHADFLAARQINTNDPLIRYALLDPNMARIINEARLASREQPLPGIKQEVFTGSGSPRQQGQEIMRQDPNWRKDPAKVKRVNDLYAQQKAIDSRKGRGK